MEVIARPGAKDRVYQRYAAPLWFYDDFPQDVVAIEEFKELALARLEVLREIEMLRTSNMPRTKYAELVDRLCIKKDLYMPRGANAQRHNHEDEKRWFANQERELFRIRFDQLDVDHRRQFFDSLRTRKQQKGADQGGTLVDLHEIDPALFRRLQPDLNSTFRSVPGQEDKELPRTYYEVAFEEVTDLVKVRRVLVRQGNAYVPHEHIVAKLLGVFRSVLSQGLAVAKRRLPDVRRDERIGAFVTGLPSTFLGEKQATLSGSVALSPANVDSMAARSFPLCMRNLHIHLVADSHLKYNGRMQYGLFVKGAGMTLEDSLTFWRSHFAKKIGVEKFQKEYAYNIRHNYGKEGKRQDYSPYPCLSIIKKMAPGAGDHHGCPFQHWDIEHLDQFLQNRCSIRSPAQLDMILEPKRQGKPQIACRACFAATHPGALPRYIEQVGNHPNLYYKASVDHYASLNK